MSEIIVGLRVDVDTTRGMREGVPALVALLGRYGVKATFFMSVGPDHMGRHVWRLLRPAFLWKMWRSKAASLYGWDILLSGAFRPGRVMGTRFAAQIRATRDAGHEMGLHAWDHYRWQRRVAGFSEGDILQDMRRGYAMLAAILGEAPKASAVPGWRCTQAVLRAQSALGFSYHSDVRGHCAFVPKVEGLRLGVQLPVTLPTYDELIGREGVDDGNYNAAILSRLRPGALNVYTIHAEVEGGSKLALFEAFLQEARARGVRFVPLGEIAAGLEEATLPACGVVQGAVPGREGWVMVQAT